MAFITELNMPGCAKFDYAGNMRQSVFDKAKRIDGDDDDDDEYNNNNNNT